MKVKWREFTMYTRDREVVTKAGDGELHNFVYADNDVVAMVNVGVCFVKIPYSFITIVSEKDSSERK